MSEVDIKELDRLLQEVFDIVIKFYKECGFQCCVGFGKCLVLVSVDLVNVWICLGNFFICDQEKMDNEIIFGMQKLLKVFCVVGLLVVYVIMVYEIIDCNVDFIDMGLWYNKILVDVVDIKDKDLWVIDSCIVFIDGEYMLLKKCVLFFYGIELVGILCVNGVDIILVIGVIVCVCVCQMICDGIVDGFCIIVVKEVIGDCVLGVVVWNLFDIDVKFGDVYIVDECVVYIDGFGVQKMVVE